MFTINRFKHLAKIHFLLIVIGFFCYSNNLFSQNIILYSKKPFSKTYTEVSQIKFSNFKNTKYFSLEKEGEKQRIGFLGKNLKPYLTRDAETKTYFKKYKHKKFVSSILKLGAFGLYVTAIVTLLNKNGNNQPFLYYLGGGLGFSITGNTLDFKAKQDLLKAIELNNK